MDRKTKSIEKLVDFMMKLKYGHAPGAIKVIFLKNNQVVGTEYLFEAK